VQGRALITRGSFGPWHSRRFFRLTGRFSRHTTDTEQDSTEPLRERGAAARRNILIAGIRLALPRADKCYQMFSNARRCLHLQTNPPPSASASATASATVKEREWWFLRSSYERQEKSKPHRSELNFKISHCTNFAHGESNHHREHVPSLHSLLGRCHAIRATERAPRGRNAMSVASRLISGAARATRNPAQPNRA
jgi:hypothetical protein